MNSKSSFSLIACLAISVIAGRAAEPSNIIFDTDMGGDCDDVGALFILHGAVERGEAKLLATMGCVSSDTIAPALDAINTWFGRPEIPVGTLKDPGFKDGKCYTDEIARCFPHRFPSGKDYPDAVALYRRILANQPDQSVIVVAVGPLRNLANLLKSPADAASRLEGVALVKRKVRKLEVMGGKYPPFESKNDKDLEYNFMVDAPSTALVCASWPTPVLFNGEGGSTCSGRRVSYEMPEHNPLTMAYANYPSVGFAGDRLSWDPVSCLVSVRGAAPWYQVVSGGSNLADAKTGMNQWQPDQDRCHSYLVLDQKRPKREVETALEDLMTASKGHPTNLKFNTAYYGRAGTCQFTSRGEAEPGSGASKAFDGDDKTAWLDKAAVSWIQCQYGEGRKYPVTSYNIVANDSQRLPRTLELSGSNDGGATWTVLDQQETPGFTAAAPRREFSVAKPAKWNIYRLSMTAAHENEGIQLASIELNQAIHCRPGVAVASVTLDQRALTLPANCRATLNASLAPSETFDRSVSWVSSDPAIADVRAIGEQCGIVVGRKPGSCTVKATINHITQTCAVTVTPSTLPPGWSYDELSSPPIPGDVRLSTGKITLTGCGHAMTSWWERVSDQGVFVNKAMTGDGEISARLTSLAPNVGGPNAYPWDNRPPSAAGLMIRESLTERCGRYLLVQIEATGNLVCRWRDKTGDQDDNSKKDLGKATLPLHLKLVQKGKQVHVFTSTDGQYWGDPKLSRDTSFDAKSRGGLFVCSGNTFATSTAEFDSLKVTE